MVSKNSMEIMRERNSGIRVQSVKLCSISQSLIQLRFRVYARLTYTSHESRIFTCILILSNKLIDCQLKRFANRRLAKMSDQYHFVGRESGIRSLHRELWLVVCFLSALFLAD